MRKAVFLDRDGTIVVDKLYLGDPDEVEITLETVDAVRRWKCAGFLLVVVSNQSGIGRGFFPKEAVDAVNARMVEKYRHQGIELDEVLFCPHNPEKEECECRKPKPKMLFDAAERLDIDLSKSAMVGDRVTDPETGLAAGCAWNILLAETPPENLPEGVLVVPSISAAADAMLGEASLKSDQPRRD